MGKPMDDIRPFEIAIPPLLEGHARRLARLAELLGLLREIAANEGDVGARHAVGDPSGASILWFGERLVEVRGEMSALMMELISSKHVRCTSTRFDSRGRRVCKLTLGGNTLVVISAPEFGAVYA
jgi:hypothetical protein